MIRSPPGKPPRPKGEGAFFVEAIAKPCFAMELPIPPPVWGTSQEDRKVMQTDHSSQHVIPSPKGEGSLHSTEILPSLRLPTQKLGLHVTLNREAAKGLPYFGEILRHRRWLRMTCWFLPSHMLNKGMPILRMTPKRGPKLGHLTGSENTEGESNRASNLFTRFACVCSDIDHFPHGGVREWRKPKR